MKSSPYLRASITVLMNYGLCGRNHRLNWEYAVFSKPVKAGAVKATYSMIPVNLNATA